MDPVIKNFLEAEKAFFEKVWQNELNKIQKGNYLNNPYVLNK